MYSHSSSNRNGSQSQEEVSHTDASETANSMSRPAVSQLVEHGAGPEAIAGGGSRMVGAMEDDWNASRDVFEYVDGDARKGVGASQGTDGLLSKSRTRTLNASIGTLQAQHPKTRPSINGAPTTLPPSPFANQRNTHPSDSSTALQQREDERGMDVNDHIGKLISLNAAVPIAQRINAPEIEMSGDESSVVALVPRKTAQSAMNGSISLISTFQTPVTSLKAYTKNYSPQPKDFEHRNSTPLLSSTHPTLSLPSHLENLSTQALQSITFPKQPSGNVQAPILASEQMSASTILTSNVNRKPVSFEQRSMSVGPEPQLSDGLDNDPQGSVVTKHIDAANSSQSTYSDHKAVPVQAYDDRNNNKSSIDPQSPDYPTLSLPMSSPRSTVPSRNFPQMAPISIPYSSVFDSNYVSTLSDDALTSADAEGESIDDMEVETLLSVFAHTHSMTRARHSASLGNISPASNPTFPPLTLTGSPFVSANNIPYPAKKRRRFLDYVEIPPFPAGKKKGDYHPLKSLREMQENARRTNLPLKQKDGRNLGQNQSPFHNVRLIHGPPRTTKRKRDYAEKVPKERKRVKTVEEDIIVSKVSNSIPKCPSPVSGWDPRSKSQRSHPDFAPSKNHIYKLSGQSRSISDVPRSFSARPADRSPSLVPRNMNILDHRKSIFESDESESDCWMIDVQDVSHDKPRVIWFHTRFIRDMLGSSSAGVGREWTALESVTEECTGGERLMVKVKLLNSDHHNFGEERAYSCGGAVKWEECPLGKDFDSHKSENLGRGMSVPEYMADLNNGNESDVITRHTTPVPESNLNGLMVAEHVVKQSPIKGERRVEKYDSQSLQSPRSDVLKSQHVPSLSSVSPEPSQQFESMNSKDRRYVPSPSSEQPSRFFLSEKAQGKQKELDSELPSTRSAASSIKQFVTSPILPPGVNDGSFRLPVPTDTHEVLDANIEQYLQFDFSPDKDKSQTHESIVVSPSLKSPMGNIGSSLHWSDAQPDLFLSQQELSSSIFREFDLDTLHSLDQFQGSLQLPLNGEGRELPLTINPSLLNHDPVQGAATAFEFELDEFVDHQQSLNPESNVDLLPSPEISASRVVSEPTSDIRSHSGELSDDSIPLASLVVRRSSTLPKNSHSRSFNRPDDEKRKASSSIAASSALYSAARFSDIEDTEHHCVFETQSDTGSNYLGSSESEGRSNVRKKQSSARRRKRRSRPPETKTQTKTPSSQSFARTSRDQRRWECGDEAEYCHQCRRKTKWLKMECCCGKKYCNRCVAVRYPALAFRPRLDGYECPYCRNECNCDICCRKRGEVYVTMQDMLGRHTARETPEAVKTVTALPKPSQRSNAVPRNLPLPPPEPVVHVPGPYRFWANVYDIDGLKIAEAYAGSQSPEKGVVVKAVEGYQRPIFEPISISEETKPSSGGKKEKPAKRIFIGCCQPSWDLGPDPYIQELESSRTRLRSTKKRKRRDNSTTKEMRWVIGKEDLLYCPVITRSKDLPLLNPFSDLSSLSSLSDGSDVEATPVSSVVHRDVNVHVMAPKVQNVQKDTISVSDFDSATVETTDIIRMLTLTLNSCGFSAVNIDKSLPNA